MHGMIAMTKNKPGPKPLPGERFPSGKLKPAKKQRGAPPEGWSPTHIRRALDQAYILAGNPLLASEIGQMLMRKELTPREASAAFAYARRVGRLEKISHGAPARWTKSQAFDFGFRGAPASGYVDPDVAEKIQAEADEVMGCIPTFPILLMTIVEEVCCNDRPINSLHLPDFKRLMNRIAEKLKIPHEADEEQAPRPARAGPANAKDVEIYGEGAVQALADTFERLNANVDEFAVVQDGSDVWIKVMGHDRSTGEVLGRKVRVEVRGMLAVQLVQRLRAFGKGKGWKLVGEAK